MSTESNFQLHWNEVPTLSQILGDCGDKEDLWSVIELGLKSHALPALGITEPHRAGDFLANAREVENWKGIGEPKKWRSCRRDLGIHDLVLNTVKVLDDRSQRILAKTPILRRDSTLVLGVDGVGLAQQLASGRQTVVASDVGLSVAGGTTSNLHIESLSSREEMRELNKDSFQQVVTAMFLGRSRFPWFTVSEMLRVIVPGGAIFLIERVYDLSTGTDDAFVAPELSLSAELPAPVGMEEVADRYGLLNEEQKKKWFVFWEWFYTCVVGQLPLGEYPLTAPSQPWEYFMILKEIGAVYVGSGLIGIESPLHQGCLHYQQWRKSF